jgi:hypothetical protein
MHQALSEAGETAKQANLPAVGDQQFVAMQSIPWLSGGESVSLFVLSWHIPVATLKAHPEEHTAVGGAKRRPVHFSSPSDTATSPGEPL